MVIRRVYSVPEHITMAGLCAGVIGAVYPVITAHTGRRRTRTAVLIVVAMSWVFQLHRFGFV